MNPAWIPTRLIPVTAGEVALGLIALACVVYAVVEIIRFHRSLPDGWKDGRP